MNNKNWIEKVSVFLLFLSVSFSISYWAIAKYDVYADLSSSDADVYIKMSNLQYDNVPSRFRGRILMPSIVRFLNSHFNINGFLNSYYEGVNKKIIQLNFGIINIISLAFTAFVLFYYCRRLGFSKNESLIGGFLFLTSFFVVTYYTIPMIDSLSSFFIIAGFYAVLRNSLWGIFLAFSFGVFTKETTFILPLLIILEERSIFNKKILVCLPATILYFLFITNLSSSVIKDNIYIFDVICKPHLMLSNFLNGLRELNLYTFIEYIQTYMFLWILLLYSLLRCKKPDFIKRSLWLLILIVIMPPFVGCAAVGRVAFYLFPLVIPLSLLALRDIFAIGQ